MVVMEVVVEVEVELSSRPGRPCKSPVLDWTGRV